MFFETEENDRLHPQALQNSIQVFFLLKKNRFTTDCWSKYLWSEGSSEFLAKVHPLHHCQVASLLVAPLQIRPGQACSEGYNCDRNLGF